MELSSSRVLDNIVDDRHFRNGVTGDEESSRLLGAVLDKTCFQAFCGSGAITALGGGALLDIKLIDSELSGNSGGSGAVLYSAVDLVNFLVSNSSVVNNRASQGGAFCTVGGVVSLTVDAGSVVSGNQATSPELGNGGAMFVARAMTTFRIGNGSIMANNTAM
ncbi:hypothetical protein GPECTOR_1g4 [Gonium pectorale]|uniref:Right handed beta helix domain-containing protein n=1 Tax=Gonium pectorale TaxID=33097 RepID=A0A150H2P3_GONPE|nr:hypothetical protein GPECTOR_1g4 [Gonium pectorale]|eukprot:KXZ56446.1 hypothetical protein GPECTOR_1g4 [Gonium pectorale]